MTIRDRAESAPFPGNNGCKASFDNRRPARLEVNATRWRIRRSARRRTCNTLLADRCKAFGRLSYRIRAFVDKSRINLQQIGARSPFFSRGLCVVDAPNPDYRDFASEMLN